MVVTDVGLLEPDPETRELTLTHVHPGVDPEHARAQTGWPLRVAADLRETRRPTRRELAALRALRTKGSGMTDVTARVGGSSPDAEPYATMADVAHPASADELHDEAGDEPRVSYVVARLGGRSARRSTSACGSARPDDAAVHDAERARPPPPGLSNTQLARPLVH